MVDVVSDVANFRSELAWEGPTVARIGGADAMLLWTDRAYHWHVNKADELFCVLNGRVEMHYRSDGEERSIWLEQGDMMVIREGEEHVAYPDGEARFLIVAAAT